MKVPFWNGKYHYKFNKKYISNLQLHNKKKINKVYILLLKWGLSIVQPGHILKVHPFTKEYIVLSYLIKITLMVILR